MKTTLWDFDGVLSDSLEVALEGINLLGKKYGLPFVKSQEDLAQVYDRELKDSLIKYGLSREETKDFYLTHAKFMEENSYRVKPFERMLTFLKEKEGINILITSSYLSAVENIIQNSCEEFFSMAIGKETSATKTQKIQIAQQTIGFNITEAIYIGDMISDVLYCREVPIDILSVGYGYHPASALREHNPTKVVETELEAIEWLKQC